MPRSMRAPSLESRSARLKLQIAKRPNWVRIGHGVSLGYRRNQGPGAWVLRVANGRGGHWTKALAVADDFDTANGGAILDFWQAQDKARAVGLLARHGDDGGGKLTTVAEAVDAYQADLRVRGGDVGNATRIRAHLPDSLAGKAAATLAARDFKSWRVSLTGAKLSPSAINRSNSCLRAALNLAADQDERITNHRAWEKGLVSIHGAAVARNVILDEPAVRAIIAAAYEIGPEFGALIEVAAVTGARVSQLGRLEVQDLQANRADPRLMLPSSKKGRGRKYIDRRPVPIPASLARRLQSVARDRPGEAPLLTKPSGGQWHKSNHIRNFARAVQAAGIDEPNKVTVYALRHSSIVRQLLAGTPIRIVAVLHDTSVGMIERNYSKHIDNVSDTLVRRALLDLAEPVIGNVAVLRR
jgi:integrase